MKWEPTDCKTGDMVRIRLGSIYHYGVFLSEDEVVQFGYPPIPEFSEQNAVVTVVAVDIDTFSCGHIVEVAVLDRKEKKKRLPPEKTAEIARARIGKDRRDRACENRRGRLQHHSQQLRAPRLRMRFRREKERTDRRYPRVLEREIQ